MAQIIVGCGDRAGLGVIGGAIKFCMDLEPNSLIMCHPGFVDDALRRTDSVTDQRTVEHKFFASGEMLEFLERANLCVSRFRI